MAFLKNYGLGELVEYMAFLKFCGLGELVELEYGLFGKKNAAKAFTSKFDVLRMF